MGKRSGEGSGENRANTQISHPEDRETSEVYGTGNQAGAGQAMLYTSEGLTFGLRPNALGLRSFEFYALFPQSQGKVALFPGERQNRRMKAVLQRVSEASVAVDGSFVGQISRGYLLLLCAMEGDTEADADGLAEKIAALRLWEGEGGKVNDRSVIDIGGEILVVSQFTLAGDTRKGRRPDYTAAAKPEVARPLLARFVAAVKQAGVQRVAEGVFGAHMAVSSVNDGPVTLLLDSR